MEKMGRIQLERQGGEQWKGQGFPVEPGMTGTRARMTERKQIENSGKGEGRLEQGRVKDVEKPDEG